ncbi:hypothetical protein GO491_03130 [Flavobacteriaceae bacterium Ap0902]|nr:hypothetical protein [Flavobacteriaceae bacterium Ap0902]
MAIELEPLINGREYGWADIICTIGGVPLTGIRKIKYGEEQEKENVYGAGRHPISRGYGRVKATASITLLAGTIMALKAKAPKGQLHNIAPFSITVNYQPDNQPLVTHVLKNCEFQKLEFDWTEGDMSKEVELELIVSHIVDKSI